MSVQVVDLFCGVGGLTRGLLDSGLNVVGGFDIDVNTPMKQTIIYNFIKKI